MNLFLFLFMIGISFIVVRIGAIAFELTGLEWSFAKFQALSCFTGTGFTTQEAELITGNPQRRRKIASVLMVLGNAGLVTLIATFANSLRPSALFPKITIPFLDLVIPAQIQPIANLLIIVTTIYYTYRFFSKSRHMKRFTDFLRRQVIKKDIIEPVSFEELLVSTGGYGISSIDICEGSPVLDKSIIDTDLRSKDINLLAIERDRKIIPNPKADTKILMGDKLICFGKLNTIKSVICIEP